jgi:hypothetical protein
MENRDRKISPPNGSRKILVRKGMNCRDSRCTGIAAFGLAWRR